MHENVKNNKYESLESKAQGDFSKRKFKYLFSKIEFNLLTQGIIADLFKLSKIVF